MTNFSIVMYAVCAICVGGFLYEMGRGHSSAYDKRPDDPPRDWQSACGYLVLAALTGWIGWAT